MYRFQVNAHTQLGEAIGLVGSTDELGCWAPEHGLTLQTRPDRYPLWWIETPLTQTQPPQRIEYKYVRLSEVGPQWEPIDHNRWLPAEPSPTNGTLVIEDGWFGHGQAWPFGYLSEPLSPIEPGSASGRKIVVLGSSVAMGCNAWRLQGWAHRLGCDLADRHGDLLINRSQLGANVGMTIDRFPGEIAPIAPDIVILALSLGNEGLAYCAPHHRRAVQRRFESGIQQLLRMIESIGAYPILGGLYPHGDYTADHAWLLRDTHERMQAFGVPVLNWLDAVDDGQGRWKPGLWFDPAHPNSEGQRLMYEAIDQRLFAELPLQRPTAGKALPSAPEQAIFSDPNGFHVFSCPESASFRLINATDHEYRIQPSWTVLQDAFRNVSELPPGIYIADDFAKVNRPCLTLGNGTPLPDTFDITAGADLHFTHATRLFSPHRCDTLFYDGHLGILKRNAEQLVIINETEHDYNVQPMWREVRRALKAMPAGIYRQPQRSDIEFRTLIVSDDGLDSRIKIPAHSGLAFVFQGDLASISRCAIIALGARCDTRMLLYKIDYDGPALPFDLTRALDVADITAILSGDFNDMWNPDLLCYDHDQRRIFHTRWTGLSFGHEVEDTDDPVGNIYPVWERMRRRYEARSERFRRALHTADEFLFVRSGYTDRAKILDLIEVLHALCANKPFQLLLLDAETSFVYHDIPEVTHYPIYFDPDRMYADADYWRTSAEQWRDILHRHGVSTHNLYWCPPNGAADETDDMGNPAIAKWSQFYREHAATARQ